MKIKEAFSRIGFTISKQNKPNQTDADAFNSLIEHFKKSEEKTVQENILFAKLYTLFLSEFITTYKEINFANKQLNKALELPLDYHVKILEMKLKSFSLLDYFKSKGVTDPNLHKDNFETYKHLFPKLNASELKESWEQWDTDNVISYLNANINLSLQNYKNNV